MHHLIIKTMNKKNKMTKPLSMFRLIVGFLLFSMVSCQSNQIEKNQGVFTADKTSLKSMLKEKTGNKNAFVSAILDKVMENAIIEFKISGDSIHGLMFLAGQTTILNSKIQIQNDSMVIKTENTDVYLIPNKKGLLFKNKNSEMSIQLLRSKRKDLSTKTKEAFAKLIQKEKELKEFTKNLNKWQKGNFVDEFGDKTGQAYPYCVIRGRHENSAVVNSEIYVKATIVGKKLYFQIFNSNMSLKESFPDSKFGTIKIKFPNGDVKRERVFFYKNTVSEFPDDKKPLIYNYLMDEQGKLKILLDLRTVNDYYSDKYQFTISKSNLNNILSQLKE